MDAAIGNEQRLTADRQNGMCSRCDDDDRACHRREPVDSGKVARHRKIGLLDSTVQWMLLITARPHK